MPRRIAWIVLGVLVLCLAYLALWPVGIRPVAWDAPADQGYSGTFAPNDALAQMKRLPLAGRTGPVAATAAADGDMLIATRDGALLRLDATDAALSAFADTQGLPLGLVSGDDGRFYVADARRGLLAVDGQGKVAVLAGSDAGGEPLGLLAGIAIGPDGMLYLSEATRRIADGDVRTAAARAILEHGGDGRVLRYDAASGRLETLADGLQFPVGLALTRDGSRLLVAETGNYRVLSIPLSQTGVGTAETLLGGLPGFPAAISRAGDGTFWLGLAAPRLRLLDMLSDRPFLRKVAARLPAGLRPGPRRHDALVHFDEDGNILETLQASSGGASFVTGAVEGPESLLFVTSLRGHAVGVLPR